ncbi:MAG: hypothetical protein WC477_06240 [Patescibacteria group bacterium]
MKIISGEIYVNAREIGCGRCDESTGINAVLTHDDRIRSEAVKAEREKATSLAEMLLAHIKYGDLKCYACETLARSILSDDKETAVEPFDELGAGMC